MIFVLCHLITLKRLRPCLIKNVCFILFIRQHENLKFMAWVRERTHEDEWTPFQTHYFSENLIVPGIELWPLDYRGGQMKTYN
jgi:hypothetical protein